MLNMTMNGCSSYWGSTELGYIGGTWNGELIVEDEPMPNIISVTEDANA